MPIKTLSFAFSFWFSLLGAFGADLRLNQIQVVGTHNSYHVQPPDASIDFAKAFAPDAESWRYTHAPLDIQLDRGMRCLELDTHYSVEGMKTFHLPALDTQSSCVLFSDCIGLIRAWSDQHPRHVPIFILVQVRVNGREDLEAEGQRPAGEKLDEEIRAVFPPEKLLTPDDVRGSFETLEQAVLTQGWPSLESCRGRTLFVLHTGGPIVEEYLKDRPSAQGRVMFPRSQEGVPYAAVLIRDNPRDFRIPDLVRLNYIVRTRADSGLVPDEGGREAGLASGAHMVSTDFPPGEAKEGGYVVALPEGVPARLNPVNASEGGEGPLE